MNFILSWGRIIDVWNGEAGSCPWQGDSSEICLLLATFKRERKEKDLSYFYVSKCKRLGDVENPESMCICEIEERSDVSNRSSLYVVMAWYLRQLVNMLFLFSQIGFFFLKIALRLQIVSVSYSRLMVCLSCCQLILCSDFSRCSTPSLDDLHAWNVEFLSTTIKYTIICTCLKTALFYTFCIGFSSCDFPIAVTQLWDLTLPLPPAYQ